MYINLSLLISLVVSCAAQRGPPRKPPPGCGPGDTTAPIIGSLEPFPGMSVNTNPFFLIAEVTDPPNNCVRKVEFELRRPNVEGSRTGFMTATRDGQTSNEYALEYTFPIEGTWAWRVKASDFERNPVTSEWIEFEVATGPVNPPTAPPTTPPTSPPVTPPPNSPPPTAPPTAPPNSPPTSPPVTPPPSPPPTDSPIATPTSPPTAPPTSPPSQDPQTILNDAKADIEAVITNNEGLAAKLLRLAFHDCVGGCDGCVDLGNPDNAGLLLPIELLDPIVDTYENEIAGVSRADIWALAALTAAELAQPRNNRIIFPMHWFGRQNCPGGAQNRIAGPDRELPSADLTIANVLHFFDEEFGFDPRQTTALLGAHSIGTLSRENSGFDGPNGWDNNNARFDNSYYNLMVGGNSPDSPLEELIAGPNWDLAFVDNTDQPTPDRHQWERTQNNGDRIILLNADIALVRDLSGDLNEETGEVTCQFRGRRNRCPHAEETIRIVAEYKHDNALFMVDFRDVFSAMLVHGYDTSTPCDNPVCPLGIENAA